MNPSHFSTVARRRSRLGLLAAGLLAAVLLVSCADLQPARAIRVGTASASHVICSAVFVSHLDGDQAYREELLPDAGMRTLDRALRYRIDRERREVTTTVAGLFEARAIYRDGLGCLVVHGQEPATRLKPDEVFAAIPESDGDFAPATPVVAHDARIRAAVDEAFSEPASPPWRHTKAVVIVHRGRVMAERYAPGIDVNTPLHGHSMTKSVMNALVGVLVRDGKLAPKASAPIPQWQSVDDPRHAVSTDHLLRNVSGLPGDEYAGGFDPSSRMWFVERDMAAFAAQAQPEAPPNTRWNYSDLGFMLVSRIVRDASGGDAAGVLRFAHRELFGPLGMRHVTFEFDATDTPLGPSHMFASARDWARFGQLYLDDGVAGGRRLLPEGWVKASTTATLDSAAYGSAWWLNTSHAPNSQCGRWGMPGAPADAYFARGYLGQYAVVVPSRQLVIVRMGLSYGDCSQITSAGRLVADVVAALDAGAQSAP